MSSLCRHFPLVFLFFVLAAKWCYLLLTPSCRLHTLHQQKFTSRSAIPAHSFFPDVNLALLLPLLQYTLIGVKILINSAFETYIQNVKTKRNRPTLSRVMKKYLVFGPCCRFVKVFTCVTKVSSIYFQSPLQGCWGAGAFPSWYFGRGGVCPG